MSSPALQSEPPERHQTWLLYGSQGWIGSQFSELVFRIPDISIIPGLARCDDRVALAKEIDTLAPDRVVAMIGRTSGFASRNSSQFPAQAVETNIPLAQVVAPRNIGDTIRDTDNSTIDWLEAPGHLRWNLRDNLFAPLLLEQLCRERAIHFTYLGTGCVYTSAGRGEAEEFGEYDEPNFFGSSYSIAKGFTDKLLGHSPVTLNARIRMPVIGSPHHKNFLSKLLAYPNIHDSLNSVTVLPDMLPVLISLIRKKVTGTYHLVNPGPMRHREILDLYRERVDPTFTYRLIDETELRQRIKAERSRCVLSTDRIKEEYHPPDLRESLARIFEQWPGSRDA